MTASITASTGRKLDFVIIAALVVALVYFVWERQSPTDSSGSGPESVAETIDSGKAEDRGDDEFLRTFAQNAVDRFGDSANVMYQAHRALLWVGDIDGASKLLPVILASDLPDDSRYFVLLRQACAENRIADANRLYTKASERFAGDASLSWLSHLIMGNDEQAVESLMEYDSNEDMMTLTSFLSYGSFDSTPFPNLTALLESRGMERGELIKLPYRCRR